MTCLPCHETDSLNNSWLDDFFSREHTPRNSVRSLRIRVGLQITLLVDGVVGDIGVT